MAFAPGRKVGNDSVAFVANVARMSIRRWRVVQEAIIAKDKIGLSGF